MENKNSSDKSNSLPQFIGGKRIFSTLSNALFNEKFINRHLANETLIGEERYQWITEARIELLGDIATLPGKNLFALTQSPSRHE